MPELNSLGVTSSWEYLPATLRRFLTHDMNRMPDFKVQLDTFHGPLDLLLYLVRKDELAIAEIPLASLTEQYLLYVELLEQLDVDAVGEFLDLASMLIEMKSKHVLPQAEEANLEPIRPQEDLVERLLEYKEYRDAAEVLQQRANTWQQKYTRSIPTPPAPSIDPQQQPLQPVELWDLVSAFARVIRDHKALAPEPERVVYDETPVHVYMERVYQKISSTAQQVTIAMLFEKEQIHKSTWIGVFLAVLELVRYRHALAFQREAYGEVYLQQGSEPFNPSTISFEDHSKAA